MTPAERRAFARHVSIAEFGQEGQERLLATGVRTAPDADPRARRWAEEHATRAGARLDGEGTPILSATPADVRAIAGRASLEEAAAFFLGALAALEHVRRTVLRPDVRPLAPISLAPGGNEGSGASSDRP